MTLRKPWDWQSVPGGRSAWQEPMAEVYPFIRRLRRQGARRVYDLGCGIGRHTVLLAAEGFEVSATDLSPEGIRSTGDWLRREGLDADLRLADMVAAPFADDEFDGALAVNVVYHSKRADVVRSVAEVRRVLKPGGLLLITFQSTRSSKFGRGRQVEPNTFVPEAGHEEGIPHLFVEREDLPDLLEGFEINRLLHREDYETSESDDRNCHWVVEAVNRKSEGRAR